MIVTQFWWEDAHPLQQLLLDAPYWFYMTGSRWMGGFTYTSDWDFMVQDSTDVRVWLTLNGFTSRWSVNPPAITDGCTADVWERVEHGQRVQIQLCHDVERKYRAALRIKHYHPEHRDLDDAARSALWRRVYATV